MCIQPERTLNSQYFLANNIFSHFSVNYNVQQCLSMLNMKLKYNTAEDSFGGDRNIHGFFTPRL